MDYSALLAKQAISELVLQYCRAIDRRDFSLLAKLYADDAIDDHGAMFNGSGEEFVQWVPTILRKMHVTSHQVMNHLIVLDPANPHYAEGEVYIQAYHLLDDKHGAKDAAGLPARKQSVAGGRYLDKYTCKSGDWQFAARKIVADYEYELPVLNNREQVGIGEDDNPATAFFTLF